MSYYWDVSTILSLHHDMEHPLYAPLQDNLDLSRQWLQMSTQSQRLYSHQNMMSIIRMWTSIDVGGA